MPVVSVVTGDECARGSSSHESLCSSYRASRDWEEYYSRRTSWGCLSLLSKKSQRKAWGSELNLQVFCQAVLKVVTIRLSAWSAYQLLHQGYWANSLWKQYFYISFSDYAYYTTKYREFIFRLKPHMHMSEASPLCDLQLASVSMGPCTGLALCLASLLPGGTQTADHPKEVVLLSSFSKEKDPEVDLHRTRHWLHVLEVARRESTGPEPGRWYSDTVHRSEKNGSVRGKEELSMYIRRIISLWQAVKCFESSFWVREQAWCFRPALWVRVASNSAEKTVQVLWCIYSFGLILHGSAEVESPCFSLTTVPDHSLRRSSDEGVEKPTAEGPHVSLPLVRMLPISCQLISQSITLCLFQLSNSLPNQPTIWHILGSISWCHLISIFPSN